MTKLAPTRMKTAASARSKKHAGARKEAPMSPQTVETRIPDRMTLARRAVCSPRSDERPLLRDERGRVLAVVEAWTPSSTN